MAETIDCGQMQEGLTLIRELKTRFDKAFDEAIQSGNPAETRRLKKELDVHIDALRSKIGVTPDEAYEYIGESMSEANVYGPNDIKEIFGFIPRRIPRIPFSPEQLASAQARGDKLVLYLGRLSEGQPATLESLVEMLRGNNSKSPLALREYEKEGFFANETARTGWTLVAGPDRDQFQATRGKDYLAQLILMKNYQKEMLEKEGPLPPALKEAYDELDEKADELNRNLRGPRWVKNSEDIANLKANQLLRESLIEATWRLMMQKKKTPKDRFNPNTETAYTWTKTRMSNGTFVKVRPLADKPGLAANEQQPSVKEGDTGLSLVRGL